MRTRRWSKWTHFFAFEWARFGDRRDPEAVHIQGCHIWFGPLGFHIFWPDVWKSRPDWHKRWGPING